MTRLAEVGLVDVKWTEDENGNVFAEGLQEYEIDTNNELAIFQGEKCIRIQECMDLVHAASMVYSWEAVCRWNLKNGKTGNGHKINEKGWDMGGWAR